MYGNNPAQAKDHFVSLCHIALCSIKSYSVEPTLLLFSLCCSLQGSKHISIAL